jgi:hypothetical protein
MSFSKRLPLWDAYRHASENPRPFGAGLTPFVRQISPASLSLPSVRRVTGGTLYCCVRAVAAGFFLVFAAAVLCRV